MYFLNISEKGNFEKRKLRTLSIFSRVSMVVKRNTYVFALLKYLPSIRSVNPPLQKIRKTLTEELDECNVFTHVNEKSDRDTLYLKNNYLSY